MKLECCWFDFIEIKFREIAFRTFANLLNKTKIVSINQLLQVILISFSYRKRVIRVNSTEDDVHLVHRELGVGKQTKSVQVALHHLFYF